MTNLFVVDNRTVIFLLFVGNLATIAILAAYKSSSNSPRSYWQFILAKLIQAAAWLLLGARAEIPDLFSVYIGNSILLAGFALEVVAVLSAGRPNRQYEIFFAVLSGVCILSFLGFATNPNLYVVLSSLATVLIFGLAAFFLLRFTNGSRLHWRLGGMYGLLSFILFFRAAIAFYQPGFALMSGNLIQSLSFLAIYLIMLLGSNGFLLLLREKTDSQLIQANHELSRLARVDSTTQLANRRAFDEALTRAVRDCRRRSEPLTLVMLDIDDFKKYNDLYGHSAGDECLSAVSRRLEKYCRRANDLAARYGGDEFAMVLPGMGTSEACVLAERICKDIYDLGILHLSSEVADRVTLSLGVFSAVPASDGQNEAWYIGEADRRLYAAKDAGRNRSVCQ